MADSVDPTISMLLTRFPEFFKLADGSPGHASSAPLQASAAQSVTSKLERGLSQSPKEPIAVKGSINASNTGGEDVGERGRPDFRDGAPPPCLNGFMSDHGSNTKAGNPSKSKESKAEAGLSKMMKMAEEYSESPDEEILENFSALILDLPASSDKSPAKHSISPPLNHALAQRASILGYQKPGASRLRNEIHESPADDDRQASEYDETEDASDSSLAESFKSGERGALPVETGSEDFPPSSSSATSLLEDAMGGAHTRALTARVDAYIGRYVPESALRDPSFQNRKEVVLLCLYQVGVAPEYYVDLPDQAVLAAFAVAGDADAREAMRQVEGVSEPSETVLNVLTSHKSTKTKGFERTEWRKATLVERPIADRFRLVPPIIHWKENHGSAQFSLSIPAPPSRLAPPPEVEVRKRGVGLSAGEWAKVPNEFRHLDQLTLTRFLDFTYNPMVRKKVLNYKRESALAGEVLDLPNKLLVALADIQEAEIKEGAKHVAGTNDIKANKQKIGMSALLEEIAELSNVDTDLKRRKNNLILLTAIDEAHESLADPNYNNFEARAKYASSKGVKLDSHLTEILKGYYEELQKLYYSSQMITNPLDQGKIVLEKLATLELNAFGQGKDEKTELVMEEAETSKVRGKEDDVLVEGSANGKGNTKRKKKGKGKGKKGKGKKRDIRMEGSTLDEGKDNDNELVPEDGTKGKGKAKENHGLQHDQAIDKGKGNESNALQQDQAIDKGKGKENDLPMEGTSIGNEGHQSRSDGSHEPKLLLFSTAPKSTPSNAVPIAINVPDKLQHQPRSIQKQHMAGLVEIYKFMEDNVRPQSASLEELDLCCRFLSEPGILDTMSRHIEELRWNRAVVEHPNNPMITKILQRTQPLRPVDGLHHDSGISVAPLPTPQYPPLPPGPAPATPAVTTHDAEKQPKKERKGLSKLKLAPIKVKLPFEDPLMVLELRDATLDAQMTAGAPFSVARMVADLTATGQNEQYLKEKARLEVFEGREVDRLVKKRKKKAGADGAEEDQLKELEQKQATLVAQMRTGALRVEEFFAEFAEAGQRKQDIEEKVRLESVGGGEADNLMERQRKMAQADGAPDWLLP